MPKFEIIWFDTNTDLQIRCKLEAKTGEEAMHRVRKAVGSPDPFACAIVELEETEEFLETTRKRQEKAWEETHGKGLSDRDLFIAGAEYERKFNNR